MVTGTPNLASALPSSTPMYPPPTTATEEGRSARNSAPVESSTRTPSTGRSASANGREPVARMQSSNSKCRRPSSSCTATRVGLAKRAVPPTMVTPAACSNWRTPEVSSSTLRRTWACTAGQSSWGVAITPKRSPWPASWKRSAAPISALDGMQPTLRQVPPIASRSTSVTCRPAWAARRAAA
jgi:hypothetical protein